MVHVIDFNTSDASLNRIIKKIKDFNPSLIIVINKRIVLDPPSEEECFYIQSNLVGNYRQLTRTAYDLEEFENSVDVWMERNPDFRYPPEVHHIPGHVDDDIPF